MPGSGETFCGVTTTATTTGAITVRVVELGVTAPRVAVMVELPTPTVCANPVAAPMVAIFMFDEVQPASVVTPENSPADGLPDAGDGLVGVEQQGGGVLGAQPGQVGHGRLAGGAVPR